MLSCSPSPLTALRVGKEQCRVARDQPVVTVRNLSVAYDGFTLHPLSFDLYPGDRLALVGPNGAGKSTLLGVLGGLNSAYAGQVLLDGVRSRGGAASGSGARIGLLPESAPRLRLDDRCATPAVSLGVRSHLERAVLPCASRAACAADRRKGGHVVERHARQARLHRG